MYDKPFIIREAVSNNAFGYDQRPGGKNGRALHVAALKEAPLSEVEEGEEVAFEDFDDSGILRTCKGLKNFVRTEWRGKPVYVFDNHNHAFAFWHLEMMRGRLRGGCAIIHLDQHKDSRQPDFFLTPQEASDAEKVFNYTNEVLNVGNFIPAARATGLAARIINLDGEAAIDAFLKEGLPDGPAPDSVLDLDLDLFAPGMDYIATEKKFAAIEKAARSATMLTIATSPFFIDQKLALARLKEMRRKLGIA